MTIARRILITISVIILCFAIDYFNIHNLLSPSLSSSRVSPSNSSLISYSIPVQDWEKYNTFRKISMQNLVFEVSSRSLEHGYYQDSCPLAEIAVRLTVEHLFEITPRVSPVLVKLLFHDCFVGGCDASILLDTTDEFESEKESPLNENFEVFYGIIDIIKSVLEKTCPRTVSCADIIVLAARDSVYLSGGPYYPVQTGRRDSMSPFKEAISHDLPRPQDDLERTIALFSSKGFDERETACLLGAHSIGVIHCKFFSDRLYNFNGTNEPDPTLDIEFLNSLRSKCYDADSSICYSQLLTPGSAMGSSYYSSLVNRKGILFADQQLTEGDETGYWVQKYASDFSLFRRDFAEVMTKLSDLNAITAPYEQVRVNCSKLN